MLSSGEVMNQEDNVVLPIENASTAKATLQKLLHEPANHLDRAVEEQNLNVDYARRINDVVLRAAQSLTARQGMVLRETFDELSSVLRDAAANGEKMASGEAQLRCVELSIAHGLEQLRIAFEWANDINMSSWDLLEERLNRSLAEARSSDTPRTEDRPVLEG